MRGRAATIRCGLLALIAVGTMPACSSDREAAAAATTGGAVVDAELVRRFDSSFAFLQTVRETTDGRLMVADPLGGVLAFMDPETGAMEPIGREGGGPGEWRQPDAVHALPGDSTLLVDLGNARLSVLDPAGTYVHSYPMALTPQAPPAGGPQQGPTMLATEILNPRVVDAEGRIYYTARPRSAGPGAGGGAPDSSEVRRWTPGGTEPVRVARLRPPAQSTTTSGGSGNVRVAMRPVPLAPQDDWAVAPDGRVAVVRAEPYHVQWVSEDGEVVAGPPVAFDPVPVGEAEKERWQEGVGSAGLAVTMSVENGATSMNFRRGTGGMPGMPAADAGEYEWPAAHPAFRPGGARVDPSGRLWVERYGRVGAPVLYDVFDDRGIHARQVRLPEGRRIIGFGADVIYAVQTDPLGLQWLEVYALPD